MESDRRLLGAAVDCLTVVIERTTNAKIEYNCRLARDLVLIAADALAAEGEASE